MKSDTAKLQEALAILSDLVQTVEAVGVDTVRDDMDWYDLHNLYRDACTLLELTPMEPDEPYDEENLDRYEQEMIDEFGDEHSSLR